MTTLHIHFDRPLTAAEAQHLRPLLSPDVALTDGGDPPAQTAILISGRPTREQLAAPAAGSARRAGGYIPARTGQPGTRDGEHGS